MPRHPNALAVVILAAVALTGCAQRHAVCDRSDAAGVLAAVAYANLPQKIDIEAERLWIVPYRAPQDLLRLNPGCCATLARSTDRDAQPGFADRIARGGVHYVALDYVEYYLDAAGRSQSHPRSRTIALDRCNRVYDPRD